MSRWPGMVQPEPARPQFLVGLGWIRSDSVGLGLTGFDSTSADAAVNRRFWWPAINFMYQPPPVLAGLRLSPANRLAHLGILLARRLKCSTASASVSSTVTFEARSCSIFQARGAVIAPPQRHHVVAKFAQNFQV